MLCLIFIIISLVSLQGVHALFYNDSSNDFGHGSCRLRSVRQAEFQWNSPERSMTESFVLDDVEYKLCKYHVTWDEALVFCSSHKAHLATLDSEEKTAFVVQAIASSSSVSEEYWIGARKLYDDPWTWNLNGMKLNPDKNVISNIPIWYPEFESNDVHCLTIDRSGHEEPIFVPRSCNQKRGFICQRDNNRAFDNKIRMVAATRIGEQEFRLYAGRATWTEAVIQCRQEGLQIGEVNTIDEARVLAISMLRNRPEGIESAWIGGYTRNDDPSTWRWIASGEKIDNNQMWRQNVSESSGGCLLLDRHVCESPIYVESACDRKRDVLCQKPSKKRLSKTPVAVVVDDCPYWIGFYPLKWSDARRSCESLNATLVVLDSPATISQMMSLMLDNKSELHHIWTDGRRTKTNGKWKWAATDEYIPGFGKSFIPWCPDDDYYTKEPGCLNLDRENLDSPLVYGLSCREKQTYVCQPLTGDCISHSLPKLPPDVMTDASEDIEERTTFVPAPTLYEDIETSPMSTITTAYPKIYLNNAIIQTTLPSENADLFDFITLKPDVKNSSSHHDFAKYLKPFTRFTLPALPQFGIKVVSAAETTTNSLEIKKKKTKAYKFVSTSSYPSTILPPLSSFSTATKISPNDARKAAQSQIKSAVVPINSNLSDPHEPKISSISTQSTTEKSKIINSTRPAFTQISPILKSFSKNVSKSKASKTSTTASSIFSEDFSSDLTSEFDKTKKYSIKTTRDLNYSNMTKTSSITTTKTPDLPILTNEKIKSGAKEYRQKSPVNSLPAKNARTNSTLMTRRKNIRFTTEATTPYDAIDEDYYNDEKDYRDTKNEDDSTDEKSDEYSEDYDSASTGKLQTKKKAKKTSSSIRKNSRPEKNEDNDDDEEEETKSSIPIAEELSKNLEHALVNMMKQGLERRKLEKPEEGRRTVEAEKGNVPWIKEETLNMTAKLKTPKLENISLRPYYAFEGPLVAVFPENPEPAEGGERPEEIAREFKFIGKHMTDESYPDVDNIEERKVPNNESRRQMKQDSPKLTNNVPISMSGMPSIQPNDPNSLMQLGRYFKNKFSGFAQNSDAASEDRRPPNTNAKQEIGQRRFGTPGRTFSQDRPRGSPANREGEARRKGQRWEKSKRPGIREAEENYYENPRRLYPRENYEIYDSSGHQNERRIEGRLREEQERLNVAWPGKNVTNYANFDEFSQAVSPRSSPIPIRTTRSFHEDAVRKTVEKRKAFPDFKLSKLVKEVKIDLDQRMLRRYLEGFARKISRKNSADKNDDWKDTWRQLLRQMLSVFDRMNINVNGDVMKLRVGSDDRDNKLSPSLGNSRETNRKKVSRLQRKESVNLKNYQSKNETLLKNSVVENEKSMQVSRKNSQNEKSAKVNSEIKGYDNRDSITERPLDDEKMKGTSMPAYGSYQGFGDKSFKNREERTDRPDVDSGGNNRRLSNSFQQKYRNFTNPLNIRRPQIMPMARLANVFGYRPLMPQLPHRIIFQPGWNQIKNAGLRKPVLNGEYLPKGVLSKIVGSGNQNHFKNDKSKHLDSTSSTAKPENHEKSRKNLVNEKSDVKLEHERKVSENNFHLDSMKEISPPEDTNKISNKSNENSKGSEKVFATDNKMNSAWKEVTEENGRNKIGNENLSGYYNVTYVDESNGRKSDDEEENRRRTDEETRNKDGNRQEDFERKPVWTPAHRLTKALELSVLRKFGGNPSNSLRSKNLVTRSIKEIEAIRQTADRNNREEKMEQNLEDMKEEPSIISLRMIMNPDKKSSRILRQSQDPRSDETNPRTVELRVQFSGKEETTKTISDGNSRNSLITNDVKNRTRVKGKNLNSLFGIKRPIRFIDKERRRAMLNRLRERNRNLKRSHLRSFATRRLNGTAISDPRERISRNIGVGGKNILGDVKASKEIPKVKHYIATSLRSFDEKNSKNRGEDKWKKGGKDLGINWAQEASALFADLKESNDDLTLYIDLTLGRVGSKPRIGGRSKG